MWPFSKSLPVPSVGRSPALSAIRCRPTRLGAGMAVVVVLLWLVGVNYQVNLAYAAAFWLLGFLIVGMLLTLRQLLSLQIDVEMPKEVFARQEAELHLRAVNNRRQRQLWLCSEDDFLNGDRPSEKLWQAWTVDAAGEKEFVWRVPARLRGRLRVPPLRTASVAHTPPQARPKADVQAAERRLKPGGDELAYLQVHQDGMPLQHVAWKTYAKTGEMMSKRFEELQAVADDRIISYRDYPAGTDNERLAGLLCRRVLDAERFGAPYVLELPRRTIAPQNGQREMCLAALALM